MAYSVDRLEEFETREVSELPETEGRFDVTWVDVCGTADESTLRAVADRFGFHPLALEDVAHLDQRAKADSYPPFAFIVARAASAEPHVTTEQMSLFARPGLVVSFQERTEDTFVPVRERVRGGRPRLRAGGADYLAYALLDFVIDSYFPVMEHLRDRLEALEEVVMTDPGPDALRAIQEIRGDLLTLRRALWPHRELLSALMRQGDPFREETQVFLRDVYDHVVQMVELIESGRELGADLMAVYLSQVSNRMNEVMKVLTMIATVFIPLSFVAGLYGMNFDPSVSRWNMPELRWAYGYPAALLAMAAVATGMVVYFVRKGWFR